MSPIRHSFVFSVVALGRLVIGQAIDELPIVNVRLGPPANALPQVAAEISVLEGARKNMETIHLQELDFAFENALKHASITVPEVVNSALGHVNGHSTQRAMSLLEFHSGRKEHVDLVSAVQSFAIEVLPPQPRRSKHSSGSSQRAVPHSTISCGQLGGEARYQRRVWKGPGIVNVYEAARV